MYTAIAIIAGYMLVGALTSAWWNYLMSRKDTYEFLTKSYKDIFPDLDDFTLYHKLDKIGSVALWLWPVFWICSIVIFIPHK